MNTMQITDELLDAVCDKHFPNMEPTHECFRAIFRGVIALHSDTIDALRSQVEYLEKVVEDQALAAAPAPQAQDHIVGVNKMVSQPVALTDEQIMAIGREMGLKCKLGGNQNIDFDYARAIEQAHGIREVK